MPAVLCSCDSGSQTVVRRLVQILKTKMSVFWNVSPCILVVHRRFRGACCLDHQGDELAAREELV
jgi:hypothetical protein